MRSAAFSFVLAASFILLTGCSSTTEEDLDSSEAMLAGRTAPTVISPFSMSFGAKLAYGTPASVDRFSQYMLFELDGTVGDEVELTAESSTRDPFIAVLGPQDPVRLAQCEYWRKSNPAYADSCRAKADYSVAAFADDESATSNKARLRTTLVAPRLRFVVGGAYYVKVLAESVRSAIDTKACAPGTPAAANLAPVPIVTRFRDCGPRTTDACGPWREQRREDGLRVGVVARGTARELWLENEGPYYRTVRDGMATSRPCIASTSCSLANGKASCAPYARAVVVPTGGTALDSTLCDSNDVGAPKFSGTIGARCLSLSAGVARKATPAGARETETVIVAGW